MGQLGQDGYGQNYRTCSRCGRPAKYTGNEYYSSSINVYCPICEFGGNKNGPDVQFESRPARYAASGGSDDQRPQSPTTVVIGGGSGGKWISVLLLIGLACFAVYWLARICIYASGLIWMPTVVGCAQLWLRIFTGREATEPHKRFARAALYGGCAALASYGLAYVFEMTSNPFPWTQTSLGSMLLWSAGICTAVGGLSIGIIRLRERPIRQHPDCSRALVRRINLNR
jgi:hypothetical protein